MDSRFSQYQQTQTMNPSYPQPSSPQTMHSTFQSSASISSFASISTSPSQTTMHSRHSPVLSSAPLPSPNAGRQATGSNYFGSISGPAMQPPAQQYQHTQQQSTSISQQPQQQQFSFDHQNQRGTSGGMSETAPYLQSFNLLAEAAKRAEMACLMRDLEDFEM